jgi:mRNA (guanine-N7-)-methyltransferase
MEKHNPPNLNPNAQLDILLRNYLPNINSSGQHTYPEFEVRFGTKGPKITKIQYDNVVKILLAKGFEQETTVERLSIGTQYVSKEGDLRESAIRVEIHGIDSIQEYCRTNTLNPKELEKNQIKFVEKQPITINGGRLDNANFTDFNFLVSYKNEKTHFSNSGVIEKMVSETGWASFKKTFRLISRIRFKNAMNPQIVIDMSVVRSSSSTFVNRKYENTYYHNVADSKVFSNQFSYEIEAELNNKLISVKDSVAQIVGLIHKTSKLILCGIQNTNFPISMSEKSNVLANYSEVVYGKVFPKMFPNNFIGPSSVTLQRHNIIPPNPQNKEPNILTIYAVTDKADGERNMLFISKTGGIYLISTGMDVLSTGTHTEDVGHFNTLIDGELIKLDKNGKFINRFVAFDIYYFNNVEYRKNAFILMQSDAKTITRLNLLNRVVSDLNQMPNKGVGSSYVSVSTKIFLHSGNIFNDCRKILDDAKTYDYNTDGLIFTHKTVGVGSEEERKSGPKRLTTWKFSFKWKPSEYNTVDFLVSTQKDKTNNDIVSSVFVEQVSMFHKTLILKCGYSEKDHGFMNPVSDVIDKIKEKENENKDELELKDDKTYKAEQFMPYDPVVPSAGFCNIFIKTDGRMQTIENELIEDDTIVEFMFDKVRYDAGESVQSCWIPLRNRYDKTAKYKSGENMFGNSYHTANSNWHSIHYAVTKEMMCGQEAVPTIDVSSDVYYNNSTNKSNTGGLRNFHNLFVKKTLIQSVCRTDDTLIDYGCGKGGDFSKWIDRKLSFVFGIDYSRDNIENRFDGAYARYLTNSKRYHAMPKVLFVNGDCSKNIKNGDAVEDDLYKQMVSAVFGHGNKSRFEEHDGIYESYGVGTDGFNVSSCQFAIHYFFKNTNTFHNFLRNVSECTATNGYFIGTCYDGHTVMRQLDRFAYDSGLKMYEGTQLICEIVKQYDTEDFDDDESCLGKQILVYQDSINQYLPEYLVNFRFLAKMMEIYGFKLLTNTELDQLNIRFATTGMFSELFRQMERNPSSEYADGLRMTESEKDVSFLNRYFIFKKINNPTAETVANSFIRPVQEDETINPTTVAEPARPVEETVLPLHRVIELKSATIAEDQEEPPIGHIQTKKITDKPTKPRTKKVAFQSSPEEGEVEELSDKQVVDEPPVVVEEKEIQAVVVEPNPKRKYTKKVVVEEKEAVEPKPKRKYTKKSI